MHIERMENLVRVLHNVEARHLDFDISSWGRKAPRCRTVACAVGWCAEDEWHNEQGLKWGGFETSSGLTVTFKDYVGMEAAQEYFQINEPLAAHLFTRHGYTRDFSKPVTAKMVRERIEGLIAAEKAGQLMPVVSALAAIEPLVLEDA